MVLLNSTVLPSSIDYGNYGHGLSFIILNDMDILYLSYHFPLFYQISMLRIKRVGWHMLELGGDIVVGGIHFVEYLE